MPRLLIDAGVLIRYAVATDPAHERVSAKLQELVESGWEVGYAPQAYREAWNAMTRPSPNGGYSLAPSAAEDALRRAGTSFTLLSEIPQAFAHWQVLAAKYGLVGKSVHDANVVATALAHGATHVLTFNERDFRRYVEVETVAI